MNKTRKEMLKTLCESHKSIVTSLVETGQFDPLEIYLFLMADSCIVSRLKATDDYAGAYITVQQSDDFSIGINTHDNTVIAIDGDTPCAGVNLPLDVCAQIDAMCDIFGKFAVEKKKLTAQFEDDLYYGIDILS